MSDTELSWEDAPAIMEHAAELHGRESCKESCDTSSLSPDQQEALSSRYACAARVLLLASGRWAVFDGLGAGASCRVVESSGLEAALVQATNSAVFRYVEELGAEPSLVWPARQRLARTDASAEELDL